MNLQEFYDYCLSKKGVTEHFPFDQDTLVFKAGGKMFALSSLKDWENGEPKLNLKCDPEKAILLRESYQAIEPGFHMSKIHWNTVAFKSDVSNKMMLELIDDSYDLIVASLTKKQQQIVLASE